LTISCAVDTSTSYDSYEERHGEFKRVCWGRQGLGFRFVDLANRVSVWRGVLRSTSILYGRWMVMQTSFPPRFVPKLRLLDFRLNARQLGFKAGGQAGLARSSKAKAGLGVFFCQLDSTSIPALRPQPQPTRREQIRGVMLMPQQTQKPNSRSFHFSVFFGMDVYQVHVFFAPQRTMTKSPLPFGEIFWGRAETPHVLERHRRAC